MAAGQTCDYQDDNTDLSILATVTSYSPKIFSSTDSLLSWTTTVAIADDQQCQRKTGRIDRACYSPATATDRRQEYFKICVFDRCQDVKLISANITKTHT